MEQEIQNVEKREGEKYEMQKINQEGLNIHPKKECFRCPKRKQK